MAVCLPPQAETILCAPGSGEAETTLARSQSKYSTGAAGLLLMTLVPAGAGTPRVGPVAPLQSPYMQEHPVPWNKESREGFGGAG